MHSTVRLQAEQYGIFSRSIISESDRGPSGMHVIFGDFCWVVSEVFGVFGLSGFDSSESLMVMVSWLFWA